MKEFERIKKMGVVGANAILVGANVNSDLSDRDLLRQSSNIQSTHFDRIRSITELIGRFAPAITQSALKQILRDDLLPFQAQDINYVASGGKQDIFKLETSQGSYALKIDRKSLGLNRAELEQRVLHLRDDYENVKSLYDSEDGFIPQEDFLVLHGPVLRAPVIAILQPFIEGDINDVFTDYSRTQLIKLLNGNKRFGQQFRSVVTKTLSIYDQSHQCIDLVGNKNFGILERIESADLILVDPHGIADFETASTERKTVLQNRLLYLNEVVDSI